MPNGTQDANFREHHLSVRHHLAGPPGLPSHLSRHQTIRRSGFPGSSSSHRDESTPVGKRPSLRAVLLRNISGNWRTRRSFLTVSKICATTQCDTVWTPLEQGIGCWDGYFWFPQRCPTTRSQTWPFAKTVMSRESASWTSRPIRTLTRGPTNVCFRTSGMPVWP